MDLLEYTVYLVSMCKTSEIKKKVWISRQKKSQNIMKNKFFAVFLPIFSCTWPPGKNFWIFFLLILTCHVLCSFSPNFERFHRVDPKIWAILICILIHIKINFNILKSILIKNMYFAFCLGTLINLKFLVLPYPKNPPFRVKTYRFAQRNLFSLEYIP